MSEKVYVGMGVIAYEGASVITVGTDFDEVFAVTEEASKEEFSVYEEFYINTWKDGKVYDTHEVKARRGY